MHFVTNTKKQLCADTLNTYHQHSHQRTLQKSGQHVTPVMLVIGHP